METGLAIIWAFRRQIERDDLQFAREFGIASASTRQASDRDRLENWVPNRSRIGYSGKLYSSNGIQRAAKPIAYFAILWEGR